MDFQVTHNIRKSSLNNSEDQIILDNMDDLKKSGP